MVKFAEPVKILEFFAADVDFSRNIPTGEKVREQFVQKIGLNEEQYKLSIKIIVD